MLYNPRARYKVFEAFGDAEGLLGVSSSVQFRNVCSQKGVRDLKEMKRSYNVTNSRYVGIGK